MNNIFTARQWIKFDLILFLIIFVFTFVIFLTPSYDINSLSPADRILADQGRYNPPLPLWKNICLLIDIILLIIRYIIYFIFCRCAFCKKHIHIARGNFCPYCSKSLDFTRAEALKIKNGNK